MRIGMGQMLVEGGRPRQNLQRAVGMIERAAAAGCRAVVLPECLDFGWTDPSALAGAEPILGPHSDRLGEAAKQNRIWVAAGLVERDRNEGERDRLYNTAVLLSPDGKIVLIHRKINELALAHELYSLGTQVGALDTELGRVGLAVCADNFPDSPEIAGALGRIGCGLLLSPCAWAVDADHDNQAQPYGGMWRDSYQAITRRFPMTVIGVSNVGRISGGPWKGRKCIGCSLAVGPGGKILAAGPYGDDAETLIVVEAEASGGDAVLSPIAASLKA